MAGLRAWLLLVRTVNQQAPESGLCSHARLCVIGLYPGVFPVSFAAIG